MTTVVTTSARLVGRVVCSAGRGQRRLWAGALGATVDMRHPLPLVSLGGGHLFAAIVTYLALPWGDPGPNALGVLLLALVVVVGLVADPGGKVRETGDWWSHAVLVRALTDAGVLPAPRRDEPAPVLHYRGRPIHDEHGTAVTVQLPAGRTFRDVLAHHEALAGALGVPVHRLAVTQQRDDPAGVVRLHVASGGSVRLDAEPAVARADRTDWRQPISLGRDGQGRPVTFRTVGTHSALVGGTGSGKTATGRLVVAHALLDPTVRVFALVAKDDAADWRAMAGLCEAYVGGVRPDALRRAEQVLGQVEALSEARADAGRNVAPVVVVIEEWYRLRSAAARLDPALGKRLDGLLGEVLATSRSRGVHVLVFAQRGTVEYLPGDQRANLLQRLVGRTGSRAEIQYVLDEAPTALPSRVGEFLVSTDERTPALVTVDHLTDDAWEAVCRRAAALRRDRPAQPAQAAQAASGAHEPPPGSVSLTKASPAPVVSVEPEPVRDPLLEAVLEVLADADPRGLPATALLERLPAWLTPPDAARLGKALRAYPEHVEPGHAKALGRVWRLPRCRRRTVAHPSPTARTTAPAPRPTLRRPPPRPCRRPRRPPLPGGRDGRPQRQRAQVEAPRLRRPHRAQAQPGRPGRRARPPGAAPGAGRRTPAVHRGRPLDQRRAARRAARPGGLPAVPRACGVPDLRPGRPGQRRHVGWRPLRTALDPTGPDRHDRYRHHREDRVMTTQSCPDCGGRRRPDDSDVLATFDHEQTCELAREERATLNADRARYVKFGTASRHRPTTPAERALLRASGLDVPVGGEMFTAVSWPSPEFRMRTWARRLVVSLDAVGQR